VPWRFRTESEHAQTVWVEPIVRVDNSLLQRDLARSGLGVVFLLSFVAERDLREGTLVPLFEGIEAEERSVHAVYPSPRHASAKVRAFVHSFKGPIGEPRGRNAARRNNSLRGAAPRP